MATCNHSGKCAREAQHSGPHAHADWRDAPEGTFATCSMWDETGRSVGQQFEHIEHFATRNQQED